jgi:hypothetical protein
MMLRDDAGDGLAQFVSGDGCECQWASRRGVVEIATQRLEDLALEPVPEAPRVERKQDAHGAGNGTMRAAGHVVRRLTRAAVSSRCSRVSSASS